MTPKQRKDWYANCLLNAGINKNSIIGILCNAWSESGGTFDPRITEYGRLKIFSSSYAFGCGVQQWSYPPVNKEVYNYARSHNEKDALKEQAAILIRNNPSQWISTSAYNLSWNDFLHNNGKHDWQYLCSAFTRDWERPANAVSTSITRRQNYSNVMPIAWGNGGGDDPDNGHIIPPNPNNNNNKRKHKMTVNDCLSMFNKAKQDYQNDDNNKNPDKPNNNDNGNGGSGNYDISKAIDLFNKMLPITIYSQSYRSRILTDLAYSDCSAFVSRAVELALGINDKTLYNTESLHAFLRNNSFKLVQSSTAHTISNLKAGDVIILGAIGTSLGDNGHTVIMKDNSTLMECAGPTGTKSMHEKNAATYITYIWPYFPNNWHYYVYRHE